MNSIITTMVHTALISLLNNQTFTSEIQNNEVIQNLLDFTNNVINFLSIYIFEIAKKMNELKKENIYITNILLLLIGLIMITIIEYRSYTANFQEILDQIQYLKKKVKSQEYALECNISNDSKLNKLSKQIKKLQKEMREYYD
jgi:hypothetical protein